jgi:transketolase
MGAIVNGLSLTGFFRPFCGTFLCFSDYMRPAIRLAALCGLDVSYQFTHDSVWLGEDGPTHQPVEHAAALRVIPNLLVFRPADGNETKAAWMSGLKHKGPKAFLLSRQNLPNLALTDLSPEESVGRGAYVLSTEKSDELLDLVLFSSGSELALSLEITEQLRTNGFNVRLVSVPCHGLFEKQSEEYKTGVLALHARKRASIEAQVSFGWHRFTGLEGRQFSIERFGMSAPLKDLQSFFAFTKAQILQELMDFLNKNS